MKFRIGNNKKRLSKSEDQLSKRQQVFVGRQGFTLVEIVLVMVITAIAFLAVYSLYAITIKHDMETRYEIIASNLAQEGVEIVRNVRDKDQLKKKDINHNLSISPCQPYFDVSNDPVCGGGRKKDVEFNGTIYRNCNIGGCVVGSQTPFQRTCSVSCDSTGGGGECVQLTVTCKVSWDSFVNSGLNRNVEAVSVLTAWQWQEN